MDNSNHDPSLLQNLWRNYLSGLPTFVRRDDPGNGMFPRKPYIFGCWDDDGDEDDDNDDDDESMTDLDETCGMDHPDDDSDDSSSVIDRTENSTQGAVINPREPPEMPRSPVKPLGQTPSLNTVVEQDTIDLFWGRFRSVQCRQENIERHLRRTRRWLRKRSHERSHRIFVEDLVNGHAKMGQDLKDMEEFMARPRLVPRESSASPGTCERLAQGEASHLSALATWSGQAAVQCQETSSIRPRLAGAGNMSRNPGKSLFHHHLLRRPF
jgi:hypothetical protein